MAQAGQLRRVASNPAIDFRAAIAQNAGQQEDLPIPGYQDGPIPSRIRSITVVSKDNLAWEVWFFRRTSTTAGQGQGDASTPPLAAANAEPVGDTLAGFWAFVATDGKQITGSSLWRYYVDGLDIPYQDDDSPGGRLHVVLVNRSAGAKTVGDGGNILVAVQLEETLAW